MNIYKLICIKNILNSIEIYVIIVISNSFYGDDTMLKKIKQTLKDACIIFTVFEFALSAIICLPLFRVNSVAKPGFAFETALLLFICAVFIRTYHNILNYEKISMPWRVFLNYLLVSGTAFGIVMINNHLFGNGNVKPWAAFLIISAFTLIYSGCIVTLIILKKKKQEKENEKKEYKSITKKK